MHLTQTLEELSIQVVGFLILFVILKNIAWRPLLKMLDERRAHIEAELQRLAQHEAELARLQTDYHQRLAKIEEEARAKIQQAILDGKRIALEIQEEARAQGATILTKSKEAVELELAKAKVTLRDQIAELTLEAVERIVRKKLDANTDRRLVEEVLDELDQQSSRTT